MIRKSGKGCQADVTVNGVRLRKQFTLKQEAAEWLARFKPATARPHREKKTGREESAKG